MIRHLATTCAVVAGAAIAGLGCSPSATGASGATGERQQAASVPPMQVGMTLGSPSYWSSEWAFNDLIQSTARLLFLTPAGSWDALTDQVHRDVTGHPVDVPAGTRLVVVVQKGSPRLPAGRYRCAISPGWSIRPFGDWQMGGGGTDFTMTIPHAEPKLGIAMILTATRPGASLTTLGCKPAASAQGAAGTFNPAFLADNRPYAVIRFMDWMRTNNSPPRRWATRATPQSFSQAGPEGVAIEHMVALANETKADPWFSLPLDADADYYRQFATYVRDHLAPGRKAYVEVSNEVWNTAFEQGKQATARGRQQYPTASERDANDYYYADRVREVMAIWSQVFAANPKRLVRVLASQAVNPARAETALSHEDTWKSVDALATAPYFGTSGNDIAATGAARVDAVFARGPQLVEEAIGQAKRAKAIASAHGLRYISYEGGAGFQSYQPAGRADMLAVNRDPRVHDLYLSYLRRWKAEVGDLLVLFDSVSTASVGGSYGHRYYTGQPLSEAPKARAVADFVGG